MTYAIDPVRLGGWLVCVYRALSYYDIDDPVFDDYHPVVTYARSAEFLSSIRSLGQIDGQKYEIYRKLARLKRDNASEILKRLEASGSVSVAWNVKTVPASVASLESNLTSKADVLSVSAQLFQQAHPPEKARVALALLDTTLHVPVREMQLGERLVKSGYSEESVKNAITDLVHIQLLARTEETEEGERLLYNPHVFEKNAKDAYKALNALSKDERDRALELLEYVRKNPGVPFPATADKKLISLLAKTGMIDISGVQLKTGTTAKEFPTSPDIWGVFSSGQNGGLSKDLIDDSKLLLNSLRYGEIYSPASKGRINDPAILVGALIKRGQVGPATAIGEDYPLPLARGIVSITESRLYPGRFFMELRKKDVAESVRDVLEQHAILPSGDVVAPEILEAGGTSFFSPEFIRAKRQLPKELIEARDSMAFELRTYRTRN